MRRVTITLLGLSILALTPAMASAQSMAEGYYFGTWKLNNTKSKRAGASYKGDSWMIIEDQGCGLYFSTVKQPGDNGQESVTQYVGKFDGKDYPMSQLRASAPATVSNSLKEPYFTTFIVKTNGKVTTLGTRKMSKDGKTLVVEMTDPQGKPHTLLWWERAK